MASYAERTDDTGKQGKSNLTLGLQTCLQEHQSQHRKAPQSIIWEKLRNPDKSQQSSKTATLNENDEIGGSHTW